MSWRPIPHADGYEMSESGDVRHHDRSLIPSYRILWGGRHAVMSAETLYRMTFDGPLPERFPGAPHSVDVDERRLEAAQRLAERLRHENDELRARFAAFGIDI
ncbi:NUMOD4 domain-containing protein [Bilophila wadsworthia]|uniref:NUMOD4 domain-containing protein n=1 Tax=Bilophila wadsworthia TaxID=35833 RepID=UPI00243115A9|nr:NUMOD4 domain-containing protein [Bilophila wadsworthia]